MQLHNSSIRRPALGHLLLSTVLQKGPYSEMWDKQDQSTEKLVWRLGSLFMVLDSREYGNQSNL